MIINILLSLYINIINLLIFLNFHTLLNLEYMYLMYALSWLIIAAIIAVTIYLIYFHTLDYVHAGRTIKRGCRTMNLHKIYCSIYS